MKKGLLLFCCISMFALKAFSQSYIDQIKLGDFFPDEIDLGGWKVHGLDDSNFMEGLNCKAYYIDYLSNANAKAGKLARFENEGGTTMSKHYFFINNDNKVVGIRKLDWVLYAGSNGLTKFLNIKKRINEYIKDFDEWEFLNEYEYRNLDRFFAYTYKSKIKPEEKLYVVVNGIKDKRYSEERYLPTSNYISLFLVADPYENEVKSTNQIMNKESLINLCKSAGRWDRSSNKCKIFLNKAMKYLEANKQIRMDDDVLQDNLIRMLNETKEDKEDHNENNENPITEKGFRSLQKKLSDYCEEIFPNENENKDFVCDCYVEGIAADFLKNQLDLDLLNDAWFKERLDKCTNRDYLNEPNMLFNFVGIDKFYIAKVNLNVRSDANTNSNVVHVLKKGDSITVKSSTINGKNIETHEINDKKVKSYWLNIELELSKTEIIEGWVFRGGLKQFFKDY